MTATLPIDASALTHRGLVNEILLALSPYGHVWANNTGAIKVDDRFLRYGQVGSADILGCIADARGVGRFVAIEVKAGRDRLSGAQTAWAAAIVRNGGLWCEARSVVDALALVAPLIARAAA